MAVLHLTETKLSMQNKDGILPVDENGYYTVTLGALNCYNSVGEFYEAKNAVQLFNSSSLLTRRIKGGYLYSELGHPKRQPNMSMTEFILRCKTIEETNICGHISEVWLDEENAKKLRDHRNPDLILVMGKVKPSGPHGPALETDLQNKKANVSFSVRTFHDRRVEKGVVINTMVEIITWDRVIEPGIAVANKWDVPLLESISDQIVTIDQLKEAINVLERSPVAQESIVDSFENAIYYLESKEKGRPVSKLRNW